MAKSQKSQKSKKSKKRSNGHSLLREVVIAGAARTPMGKFGGGLSTVPATSLGAMAVAGADQLRYHVRLSED